MVPTKRQTYTPTNGSDNKTPAPNVVETTNFRWYRAEKYQHVCPSVLANDLNCLHIFAGSDVHLGSGLRFIQVARPVRLFRHQQLPLRTVILTNEVLQEHIARKMWKYDQK